MRWTKGWHHHALRCPCRHLQRNESREVHCIPCSALNTQDTNAHNTHEDYCVHWCRTRVTTKRPPTTKTPNTTKAMKTMKSFLEIQTRHVTKEPPANPHRAKPARTSAGAGSAWLELHGIDSLTSRPGPPKCAMSRNVKFRRLQSSSGKSSMSRKSDLQQVPQTGPLPCHI